MCLSVQVPTQPQWQAPDPCNDDGKVRDGMALERQKAFRIVGFGFVGFFFFSPGQSSVSLEHRRSLKIAMAEVVSSK